MPNLYSYYFQVLFIALIIVNHMVEIYLAHRQVDTLQKNRTEVPAAFQAFLSLEDHQKAVAYNISKLYFSIAHLVWNALFLFYWFPFRGAEKLFLRLPEIGIHRDVLFLLIFVGINMLLSLPWSIYSTFVLEEKFGFNRTQPKIFVLDRMKGIALGSALGIPLLYAVILFYQSFPTYWWLISFITLTLVQFFLIWLYPTLIAPLFNKFQPMEDKELDAGISKLVGNAGFETSGVFVMDASKRSSHGNAYFTGLGKNKRIVFFDTLLKNLTHSEIFAILAHELGHLKLKHIPKSMMISIFLTFIGFWLMGQLSSQMWFYRGHFIRISSPGVLLLLFMEAIPVYTFWGTPLRSWFSRKNEFEADAYAAQETKAQDLILGLLKLYKHNYGSLISDKLYATFYYSHPPAPERIKRLEALKKLDP